MNNTITPGDTYTTDHDDIIDDRTPNNFQRREKDGKYGHINIWLDSWTRMRLKSWGDSWNFNNNPEPELLSLWVEHRDKVLEEVLHLDSFDPETGTDFHWWQKTPKEKQKLRVKMTPTKDGEDRELGVVKVHPPGVKNECTMYGGDDVIAEWIH